MTGATAAELMIASVYIANMMYPPSVNYVDTQTLFLYKYSNNGKQKNPQATIRYKDHLCNNLNFPRMFTVFYRHLKRTLYTIFDPMKPYNICLLMEN